MCRSPVMILLWRVKLTCVGQCLRLKDQRLVHCVDVTFACNVLGLACQAYLGGSMLWIQEPKIGALR